MKIFRKLTKVISKKVSILSILCFFLIFMFFSLLMPVRSEGSSDAAGSTINPCGGNKSPQEIYLNECNNQGFLPNLARSLSLLIDNDVVITPDTESSSDFSRMGGIQFIGYMSDKLYSEQPGSAMIWAQDQYNMILGNSSLTVQAANPNDTSAYAPGTGYNILQPVLGMWQWSRNLVYSFFIVILIFLAFLILLRRPMGGQEVITIANSLPSIAISIILVTFSYAICGLFIDAVYIGSNFVYNVMIAQPNAPGKGLGNIDIQKLNEKGEPAGTVIQYDKILQPDDPQMSVWAITTTSNQKICYEWGHNIETCQISEYIFPAGANQYRWSGILRIIAQLPDTVPHVVNPLVELILLLAIFKVAFDLFFILLNSYITLSFYPIVAPFIFMTTALPSRTHMIITNFIKSLGSAALNFIIVYILFLFLVILGNSSAGNVSQMEPAFNQVGQLKWAPPLLGYSQKQIFDATSKGTGGGMNIISTVVMFGLYMATPNIVKQAQKVFELPEMSSLKNTGKNIMDIGKSGLATYGSLIGRAFDQDWFKKKK